MFKRTVGRLRVNVREAALCKAISGVFRHIFEPYKALFCKPLRVK
jgi:hypothetical protein